MDEDAQQAPRDEVMNPKQFLSHTVRVHTKRQQLRQVFDGKAHWVFAMTHECGEIAVQLPQVCEHGGREGERVPAAVVVAADGQRRVAAAGQQRPHGRRLHGGQPGRRRTDALCHAGQARSQAAE